MKKTYFKFNLLFALSFLSIALCSCSSNNDNDDNGGSGDNTSFSDIVSIPQTAAGASQKAVDLGLSVKWSENNYGYCCWGDGTGKLSGDAVYDVFDKELPPKDISGTVLDAIRMNWGGEWRLPTEAEYEELIEKCKKVYTLDGSMGGITFVGPNGNSVFFPFVGGDDGVVRYSKGKYWTATRIDNVNKFRAMYVSLDHNYDRVNVVYTLDDRIYLRFTLRGVRN
jgi:hypothetical protein